MPRHDPIPAASSGLRHRFWRAFRLLAILAAAVGVIAALIVGRGVAGLHLHMLVATALGAGFIVLVGGALMTLVFLSANSGHDSEAALPPNQEKD